MKNNIKIILGIIALLYGTYASHAQEHTFQWAKKMGGTGIDRGIGITTDIQGNVYNIGYFIGTADFDPGPGVFNLVSAGGNDVYITKLDSSGDLIWAIQMGSTANDEGYGITVDSSGNVYTVGNYRGTVDFDPGTGVYNLTAEGNCDVFVYKLNTDGEFVWAKSLGGTDLDYSWSVTLDNTGNVYLSGYFWGFADFDPGAGVFSMTSSGNSDAFVVKLDSSGNFVWAKKTGGSNSIVGSYVRLDESTNVYLSGSFMGTADFDPGVAVFNMTSSGGYDAFIVKLDSSGNFIWAKKTGGAGSDQSIAISLESSGDVYISGFFQSTVDFDPGAGVFNMTSAGGFDSYISKLDSSGNFIWAKRIGGAGDDYIGLGCIDSLCNIYSSGYFQGTADFDPGSGLFNLTSAGGYDVIILNLDSSGNFVWAERIGASGDDYAEGIAINSNKYVYTSGSFTATVDFDPGLGYYPLISDGGRDVFIHKIKMCFNTNSDLTSSACDSYTAPDGQVHTTSGIKTAVIPNAAGCDSTITIDLTIKNSTTSSINETACDSYTSPSGKIWTTSRIENDTILNLAGCDSVITVNLTINNSTTSSINETACDSYSSPSGKIWTTSRIENDTILNLAGCDSVITVNLTINNSNTGDTTAIACYSYTLNGTTYNASGTYTQTLVNASGCDSTITINLTINTVDTSVTQNGVLLTANATGVIYQWLDCNNANSVINGETNQSFNAAQNGSYAVEVTQNSCVDTSACYSVTTVSILENTFDNDITVFPNPTNGLVKINLGESLNEFTVIINDASGRIIKQTTFIKTEMFEINLDAPSGMYLLTIKSENKKATISLIKN